MALVPVDTDDVYTLALAVRDILEQLHESDALIPGMEEFPRGCCGTVAQLLAKILQYYGHHVQDVVGAELAKNRNETHAWVDLGNRVALDITGDQVTGRPRVYLGPEDKWFAGWIRDEAVTFSRLSQEESVLFQRILTRLNVDNSSSEDIGGH